MSGSINLIVATNLVGTIGDNNAIPWYIPSDMQRFKQLTTGGVVIMGRKTWESLPERFRPLPNRLNVVITRQQFYNAPGAEVYHTLGQAIADHQQIGRDIWIMGGAEIYLLALHLCEYAYVTEVHDSRHGDTKLPKIEGELMSIIHEIQDQPDGSILKFDFKKIKLKHQ